MSNESEMRREMRAWGEGIVERIRELSASECDYSQYPDGVDGDGNPLDLDAYLSDCLDVRFMVGMDMEYQGAVICIAWGGPNGYIDTIMNVIRFHWGSKDVEVPLPLDVADAVDRWAENLYECGRCARWSSMCAWT